MTAQTEKNSAEPTLAEKKIYTRRNFLKIISALLTGVALRSLMGKQKIGFADIADFADRLPTLDELLNRDQLLIFKFNQEVTNKIITYLLPVTDLEAFTSAEFDRQQLALREFLMLVKNNCPSTQATLTVLQPSPLDKSVYDFDRVDGGLELMDGDVPIETANLILKFSQQNFSLDRRTAQQLAAVTGLPSQGADALIRRFGAVNADLEIELTFDSGTVDVIFRFKLDQVGSKPNQRPIPVLDFRFFEIFNFLREEKLSAGYEDNLNSKQNLPSAHQGHGEQSDAEFEVKFSKLLIFLDHIFADFVFFFDQSQLEKIAQIIPDVREIQAQVVERKKQVFNPMDIVNQIKILQREVEIAKNPAIKDELARYLGILTKIQAQLQNDPTGQSINFDMFAEFYGPSFTVLKILPDQTVFTRNPLHQASSSIQGGTQLQFYNETEKLIIQPSQATGPVHRESGSPFAQLDLQSSVQKKPDGLDAKLEYYRRPEISQLTPETEQAVNQIIQEIVNSWPIQQEQFSAELGMFVPNSTDWNTHITTIEPYIPAESVEDQQLQVTDVNLEIDFNSLRRRFFRKEFFEVIVIIDGASYLFSFGKYDQSSSAQSLFGGSVMANSGSQEVIPFVDTIKPHEKNGKILDLIEEIFKILDTGKHI